MTGKKRRGFWLVMVVGLAVVALGFLGVMAVRRNERLLIDVAHPVMKWDKTKEAVYGISGNHLLIITKSPPDNFSGEDVKAPSIQEERHDSAELLNLKTGMRTRLTGITALLNRTNDFPFASAFGFTTSADGVWLFWRNTDKQLSELLCAAHLDGSHYREWSFRFTDYTFVPDSRHVVQVPEKTSVVIVHDLMDPTQDRKYTQREQAKAVLTRYGSHQSDFLHVYDASGDDAEGYAAIDAYRMEDYIRSRFPDPGTKSKDPEPRTVQKLKLPKETTFISGDVSPQQKSVLYYLQMSQTPVALSWLHRIIPKFAAKPIVTEGLWVSRLDGRGMREIGHVAATVDRNSDPTKGELFISWNPDGNPADQLKDVQWLPDGKKVRFVYHGVLYVAPAEPAP